MVSGGCDAVPQRAARGTGDSRTALSFCNSGLYVFNTRVWGGGSGAAVAEPAWRRGLTSQLAEASGVPLCLRGRRAAARLKKRLPSAGSGTRDDHAIAVGPAAVGEMHATTQGSTSIGSPLAALAGHLVTTMASCAALHGTPAAPLAMDEPTRTDSRDEHCPRARGCSPHTRQGPRAH